jgi:hypothetical protein
MFCEGRNKGGRGRESAREREREREGERGHHKQGGREIPCSLFFSLSTLVMAVWGVHDE